MNNNYKEWIPSSDENGNQYYYNQVRIVVIISDIVNQFILFYIHVISSLVNLHGSFLLVIAILMGMRLVIIIKILPL